MISVEHVKTINELDYSSYVIKNPNSLIYSSINFINLITKHLKAKSEWLIAKEDQKTLGILPFVIKEGDLGPVYNSLAYYGSNGSIIQNIYHYKSKKKLVDSYYELAKENNACSATLITNPLVKDHNFYDDNIDCTYKDYRIGQITILPKNNENLINIFQSPRPRNIRRALKENVQIEISNEKWAIDFLYNTHKTEMESKGGLAKKKLFFDLLSKELDLSEWKIFVAKLNDKPIGALLLLYYNKTVEYFTPAIINKYRKTQASSLII